MSPDLAYKEDPAMPMNPDQKRVWNREKMRRERAAAKQPKKLASRENAVARTVLQGTPYRDEFGDLVLDRGGGVDQGGEHYWGWVSKAPTPDTRICLEFEYQGRMIGGCRMVKAWEGKSLDGGFDLAATIIASGRAKEIIEKMPVTKARER